MMFAFTHPNKILYPEQKISKTDVVQYFDSVKELILPYIRNRLLSLVRCPEGYKHQCFFQKHPSEHDTEFLCTLYSSEMKMQQGASERHVINVKDMPDDAPYFYLKNVSGLLYLAQISVLEIHSWGSHIKNLEKPDVMIFDLDPSSVLEWKTVVQIARFMRSELEKLNLASFVKTTGGKGLHIVVPIKPKYSWDEVKNFAQAFAKHIAFLKPKLCTEHMGKAARRGKIFIDYLRNTRGATIVAPYSLRARKGAPISTPLHWEELTAKIHSNFYTIKNFSERLKRLKEDPWVDLYKTSGQLLTDTKTEHCSRYCSGKTSQ